MAKYREGSICYETNRFSRSLCGFNLFFSFCPHARYPQVKHFAFRGIGVAHIGFGHPHIVACVVPQNFHKIAMQHIHNVIPISLALNPLHAF